MMKLLSSVAIALALASNALAANFNVTVGENNTFAFNPTEIHPEVGDTVTFQFLSRVREY
jgi:plastocyanin